jgi:hypothetical protein
VDAEVGSPDGDERFAQLAERRLAGLPGERCADQDAPRRPVAELADSVLAPFVAAEAPLRLLAHLDLGDQGADRGIPAGELDAGGLADEAPAAVAPDEELRPQGVTAAELDVDAGVVLREARHVPSAVDRDGELLDPTGQDLLEPLLPEREPIVVTGGKVADVERDERE